MKTTTRRIITEVFHCYATCLILRFLLRTFFERVAELLHLLTVPPKLNFQGSVKKALIVLEDRFYLISYFAKIFPSPLSLTLHIHCTRNCSKCCITINILFILGNNYTVQKCYIKLKFLHNRKKNHKPFDTLNGSILRAAALITENILHYKKDLVSIYVLISVKEIQAAGTFSFIPCI